MLLICSDVIRLSARSSFLKLNQRDALIAKIQEEHKSHTGKTGQDSKIQYLEKLREKPYYRAHFFRCMNKNRAPNSSICIVYAYLQLIIIKRYREL